MYNQIKDRTISSSFHEAPLHFMAVVLFFNLAIFPIEIKFIFLNSFYWTFIISLVYITISERWGLMLGLLRYEIGLLLLILFYSLLLVILVKADISFFKAHLSILGFIITAFSITTFCVKHKFNIMDVFLVAILIQVTISILLYMSPQIFDMLSSFIDFKYRDSEAPRLFDGSRGFALMSRGPYYDYPIAVGLCVVIMLNRVITKQIPGIYLLIPITLSLIAIGINARIGFVPIVGYILYLTFRKISVKKILSIILASIFIFFTVQGLIEYTHNEKLEWAVMPFVWSYNFLINNGGEIGHLRPLFGQFIFFPVETEELIRGTGKDVFQLNYIQGLGTVSSDVGYIRQINYGGILYFVFIAIFFLYFIKKLIKNDQENNNTHFIPITFIITIIVANIKGNFFQLQSALQVILLIYIFLLCKNKIVRK